MWMQVWLPGDGWTAIRYQRLKLIPETLDPVDLPRVVNSDRRITAPGRCCPAQPGSAVEDARLSGDQLHAGEFGKNIEILVDVCFGMSNADARPAE